MNKSSRCSSSATRRRPRAIPTGDRRSREVSAAAGRRRAAARRDDRRRASGQIDFQALYDQRGRSRTPTRSRRWNASSTVSTRACPTRRSWPPRRRSWAIGKSVADVVNDAGRKITVVRAVQDAKQADTQNAAGQRQARDRGAAEADRRPPRLDGGDTAGPRVGPLAVRDRGVAPGCAPGRRRRPT